MRRNHIIEFKIQVSTLNGNAVLISNLEVFYLLVCERKFVSIHHCLRGFAGVRRLSCG